VETEEKVTGDFTQKTVAHEPSISVPIQAARRRGPITRADCVGATAGEGSLPIMLLEIGPAHSIGPEERLVAADRPIDARDDHCGLLCAVSGNPNDMLLTFATSRRERIIRE
jgi:hypothetical protein